MRTGFKTPFVVIMSSRAALVYKMQCYKTVLPFFTISRHWSELKISNRHWPKKIYSMDKLRYSIPNWTHFKTSYKHNFQSVMETAGKPLLARP
jgi:hypothetical protein